MNDWKKVLIAVDDTPTSDRGLTYAGNILGKLDDVQICLIHIYPEPPPDYYQKGGSLSDYKKQREEQGAALFKRTAGILKGFGIQERAISQDIRMAEETTISKALLAAQEVGEFGTMVVGKRGVSKAEEFLFGSISNALVHHTHDCTVWVIG